jgi:hypothetical protein
MLLSHPGRSFGRVVGDGFKPMDLGDNVLWIDALERHTYSVTAGVGGALGTVGSIVNQATGVAWTEGTGSNQPFFEQPDSWGRPCLRGDGVARRLMSTEAGVLAAFNGADHSFTVAMVVEPLDCSVTSYYFALADAATDVERSKQAFANRSSGLYRYIREDDAAVVTTRNLVQIMSPGPHIITFRFNSAAPTQIGYWLDDEPAEVVGTITDVGTITSTRAGLFCDPDLTVSGFLNGRIGAICAFDSYLGNDDLLRLRTWLLSRWLSLPQRPNAIPNCTVWCFDAAGVSGNNIIAWGDKAGAQDFDAPAGAEPFWLGTEKPINVMQFQGTDALVNSTALATSAITIALKFKLDSLPSVGSSFMLASPRMGVDKWFQLMAFNAFTGFHDWSFGFQNGLSNQQMMGIDGLTLDGGIHSLVVTYDGAGTSTSDYQCWLDGVQQTVSLSGLKNRNTGDKGSLGAEVSSTDVLARALIGKLYEFATFDRVLTAAEIDALNYRLAYGWRFGPEVLDAIKLDLDLRDTSTYVVTLGSPDTVTSLRNKATHALWTPIGTAPKHESAGFNSQFPCISNPAGDSRDIASTESAVFDVFDGADTPHTVYLVCEPLVLDEASAYLGAANTAGMASALVGAYSTDEGHSLALKIDDAGLSATAISSRAVFPGPQVLAWSVPGTTANGYLDDGPADPANAPFNVANLTLNRSALFCVPSNVLANFGHVKIARALAYKASHSEANVRAMTRYLSTLYGIGFNPLTLAGLVAWFDMMNAASYTVTPGSPDTVTSIKNLVSNVAWNTAATAFPLYEAAGFGGLPCMRGQSIALGGPTNRGIISTESPVVNAFSGTDVPVTVIAVTEFDKTSNTEVLFGLGNSGFSTNQTWRFGQPSGAPLGRPWFNKIEDGTGTQFDVLSSAGIAAGRRVVSFVCAGTTGSIYVDQNAPNPSGAAFDAGAVTPNRAALFCRPDSVPDFFWASTLAELLVFNRAITDLEKKLVVGGYLMPKWGIS